MIRRLRLWSGLVLFAYVATHLANHALGLISLEELERGRAWFLALWRNPVGTVALYGAMATHLSLVLWGLYQRRALRMPGWEAGQIVLGLVIPVLLIEHIIGTRLLHELYGVEDSYVYVVLILWEFVPEKGALQSVLLIIAWLHGCMGLHFWLRLQPWYARALPYLYATALLLPTLALLGFANAGQTIALLAREGDWVAATLAELHFPDEAAVGFALALIERMKYGFVGLVVAVALARVARLAWERRHGVFIISYPGNRRVRARPGITILEASRGAGIPHASVCGGRGRCSTCRVRVGEGIDDLEPPSAGEARVLKRVKVPPNVRLACQTRPTRDVEVIPLLPPDAGPRDARPRPNHMQGTEREIAVLFADIRAFTQFSEHKLPYDVVFVLNRYFRSMGEAVEGAGGQVDKFIGDGVMALFGVDGDGARACRQALAGARAMSNMLDELNRTLANDLEEPLRMGIGIHFGPAIVGEMGYAKAIGVTAIGDTVNTASRLETLTKEFTCQLIVSSEVERNAGVDLAAFPEHDVEVRGRRDRLRIRAIDDARTLPDLVAGDRASGRGRAAAGTNG